MKTRERGKNKSFQKERKTNTSKEVAYIHKEYGLIIG